MNWKDIKNPPKEAGWYAGAVNPVNHDADNPHTSNGWREKFGFTKAWYNPDAPGGCWFEPDPHGHGQHSISNRITHWDELPKVPMYPTP